jgi:hypothetical protein
MGPVGHASVSTVVGAGVWAATGSLEAGVLTLGVGVLMDVDHIYDYYQMYIRKRHDKFYVLFHAWEYSVIGIALLASVFYHPLFLATVAAHLSHVITDQLHNHVSPLGYSIIYRIIKRFDAGTLAPKHNPATSYWRLLKALPYGKRLAPWFQKRVAEAKGPAEDSPVLGLGPQPQDD